MPEPTPPNTLVSLQTWFATLITPPFRTTGRFHLPLYDPATKQDIAHKLTPGPFLTAAERIGIYRQQYWWRLFLILQEQFPTLVRLFGHAEFNQTIAEPYLLRHPPNDWFLPHLGSHLPSWIENFYYQPDRELILSAATVDDAYQKVFLTSHPILLHLRANFFAFREALLQFDVNAWQDRPFPPLDWSETPQVYSLSLSGDHAEYVQIVGID
jgi:hypothetical protein